MPRKITTRLFGQQQEQIAEQYLRRKGLALIERNYLCKSGEIDLVMNDGDNLVFVEVRYRQLSIHGSAAESVTPKKRHKIINAAKHYLLNKPKYRRYNCRFDVVSVSPASGSTQPNIQWIPAAFDSF